MKKILITQRLTQESSYKEQRDALDVRWASFLEPLGIIPIPAASNYPASRYFEEFALDGILLTGGNNVSSVSRDPLDLHREKFEVALLECALSTKLPTLGVCKGLQLLAQHYGHSLRPIENHVACNHPLQIEQSSKYLKSLHDNQTVNSYHNYAPEFGGGELVVSARAPDGTIEALEHLTLPVLGIMWHPEREEPLSEQDKALFQLFFNGEKV